MNKVLISVEGQTEERFVASILQPFFASDELVLQPVIIKTRQNPDRPDNKGGYVPYERVKRQLKNLLGDSSAIAVTTMYDFYALPPDFPGYGTLPRANGATQVAHLENALVQDLAHPRFHPYLQLYEFEALLFADVEQVNASLDGGDYTLGQLREIQQAFPSPEEINDGVNTAPSKRIKHIFSGYEKVLSGLQVTQRIGLTRLRNACPHFNQWVLWLEDLTI